MPFGLISLVRAGMERLELNALLDGYKKKGVPLSTVIQLMLVDALEGNNSMNRSAERRDSPLAREYLSGGKTVSQRTMNRALEDLDLWFEEIIDHLWTRVNELYRFESTDVYVDGSHIVRYGLKGGLTRYGEGAGKVQPQVQFMVAQLIGSGIPVAVEAYPGNLNDPPQYDDFIAQLMFLLKKGSMIVMDHGGSSKDLLDEITDEGLRYLTRKSLNASDIRRIKDEVETLEYVGDGTACIKHVFRDSGRTTYLFFSASMYMRGRMIAERSAMRTAEDLKGARETAEDPKVSKLVKVAKNPFYDVADVKCTIQMKLNPWVEEDLEAAVDELSGETCGWFKLECSEDLPSEEALSIYRHRTDIEHLISSMKSVVHIKPLRVWSDASVRGAILLVFIAQLMVSMLRYDMDRPAAGRSAGADPASRREAEGKPSPKAIVDSLGHLTVTLVSRDEGGFDEIYSNMEPLNAELMNIIEHKWHYDVYDKTDKRGRGPRQTRFRV